MSHDAHRTRERLTAEQIAALPPVITTAEAASILGVADPTVRKLALQGSVKGSRLGSGIWRFSKASVLAIAGIGEAGA